MVMCIFMEWSYSVLSNNCLKIPKYINHKIFLHIIIMKSQGKSLNTYLTVHVELNIKFGQKSQKKTTSFKKEGRELEFYGVGTVFYVQDLSKSM